MRGDAWSSGCAWIVNFNNGNVNNNNRNNRAFVRAVRRVSPAGECQGEASLRALYQAWRAARRKKQPSRNQLAFELRSIDRMLDLQDRLNAGTWSPAPTTCFVATRPKAREIHAPDFGDRVVHHWLVPQLEDIYEPTFIHDSYANRKGKGTHAAVRRLQQFARQVHSGQGGGWYLQLDVHNCFNSIHRATLYRMLKARLTRAGLGEVPMRAVHALLRHPVQQQGVIYRATATERALVPPHKRLENAPPGCGLPIGNLSSQFFANVYLDALDQFVKHTLKAKRYLRYVDDFVLVHRDRAQLEEWRVAIERFLGQELRLGLKADQRLRPLSAGIDFLGYVVYPTHTRVRSRVLRHAADSLQRWQQAHQTAAGFRGTPEDFQRLDAVWASYQGHLAHANSWRLQQHFLRRRPWLAALTHNRRRFHHRLSGRRLTVRVSNA
ncbi:MAG TPA: reverse transcriptase domain-containing protein [Frateuria sp.]|uniref:RNA-directed DNA polymerase n=1 Tax=Frateuria sp. TaxID=2211372 RepID=UPI002D811603|nr:reverse transcriptase domain-containing protein [Frateuria sp.]HET6805645.1 reverse transcriptase domain-containing protein [Frateuria sp.]